MNLNLMTDVSFHFNLIKAHTMNVLSLSPGPRWPTGHSWSFIYLLLTLMARQNSYITNRHIQSRKTQGIFLLGQQNTHIIIWHTEHEYKGMFLWVDRIDTLPSDIQSRKTQGIFLFGQQNAHIIIRHTEQENTRDIPLGSTEYTHYHPTYRVGKHKGYSSLVNRMHTLSSDIQSRKHKGYSSWVDRIHTLSSDIQSRKTQGIFLLGRQNTHIIIRHTEQENTRDIPLGSRERERDQERERSRERDQERDRSRER